MLLRDYVRRAAKSYPDKIAFVDGDLKRNWREFHERTDRFGAALQTLGVRKGDRVCIMAHDHVEVVEHWLACTKIGAVRVGVNWRYAAREKLHIIRDSNAKLVLLQSNCIESLTPYLDELRGEGRIFVGFGGKHNLEHDYEQLIAVADGPEPVPLDAADIAAFSYTTGTTGLPKGAIWSNGAVLSSLTHAVLNMGWRHQDVMLSPAPMMGAPILFNSYGVINGMTTVLVGGDFSAPSFWELVQRHCVTATMGVPTMIRRVLDEYAEGHYDASTLRSVFYGSAPMSPSLIRETYRVLDCEIIQVYGSTETCGAATYLREEDHRRALSTEDFRLLESCGRPSPQVDVMILREDASLADVNEVGELCIRSDTNAVGYHNSAPEQCDLYNGEWLRTGDLGRIDADGFIYLVDRKKFMMISGGYNVYPVVVENILAEHGAVREVAVLGVPHPEWGEAVTAFVSLKPNAQTSPDELIEFTRPHLGKWEVPKHVAIMDDLPKGVTGKIDKLALRHHCKLHPEAIPWLAAEAGS